MEPKKWYQSKTIWANVAALVAAIGVYVQTQDVSALGVAVLAILNTVFRFITRQPVE